LSWYFHHLPRPLHRVEVLANHAAQLVVPFGLFAPQPVARVAGLVIIVTQAWLLVSGNFSWLNLITIVLATSALDDTLLRAVLPVDPPDRLGAPPPLAAPRRGPLLPGAPPDRLAAPAGWQQAAVVALALLVAVLSVRPARNLVGRRQLMNASFDPLRLVNTYGAFGAITRVRREVLLEGPDAPAPGPDTVWAEYQFKAKPGDPRRRPRQVAPYHLRLDWLLWVGGLSPPLGPPLDGHAGDPAAGERPGHREAARPQPVPRPPAGPGPGPAVPLPVHHPRRTPPARRLVVPRAARRLPPAAAPRPCQRGTSSSANAPRNRPTSVTTPVAWAEPRSASLVTVDGLMSTQTSGTEAGSRLPVAIEWSMAATIRADPTPPGRERSGGGASAASVTVAGRGPSAGTEPPRTKSTPFTTQACM